MHGFNALSFAGIITVYCYRPVNSKLADWALQGDEFDETEVGTALSAGSVSASAWQVLGYAPFNSMHGTLPFKNNIVFFTCILHMHRSECPMF